MCKIPNFAQCIDSHDRANYILLTYNPSKCMYPSCLSHASFKMLNLNSKFLMNSNMTNKFLRLFFQAKNSNSIFLLCNSQLFSKDNQFRVIPKLNDQSIDHSISWLVTKIVYWFSEHLSYVIFKNSIINFMRSLFNPYLLENKTLSKKSFNSQVWHILQK